MKAPPRGRSTLDNRLYLLWSYHYIRSMNGLLAVFNAARPYMNVMLDCGAFSDYAQQKKAQQQGKPYKPLTLNDYIAFLHDYKHLFWQYVALDAIHAPRKTRQNLQRMVGSGLRPMPVLVTTADAQEANDLLEVNQWLCVAGGVDGQRAWCEHRYRSVHAATNGQARIHALGYVKMPSILRLPVASADSSSLNKGGRFGLVSWYNAQRGRIRQKLWTDATLHRDPEWLGVMKRARIDWRHVIGKQAQTAVHGAASLLSSMSYYLQMQHARQHSLAIIPAVATRVYMDLIVACAYVRAGRTDDGFDYRSLQTAYRAIVQTPLGSRDHCDLTVAYLKHAAEYGFTPTERPAHAASAPAADRAVP